MRKAQAVSIFIIIGILLVLGFAIYSSMTSEQASRRLERSAAPTLEQVPTEAQPIFSFITDCIEQVTKDGLIKLGDRGGYLDTDALRVSPLAPTESDAVQFDFDSELKIPYWYEMKAPDNCEKTTGCTFLSRRPLLYKDQGGLSIEGQMDGYIEQELPRCLRDFDQFTQRRISVDVKSPPVSDFRVNDDGVSTLVEMPITVRTPAGTHDFDTYYAELPDLHLKDMYELATHLAGLEANYSYLEKNAFNLITLYSGTDAQLPPVGATEFGLGPGEYWIKNTVKDNIRTRILPSYTPMLQVFGTANYNPVLLGGGDGPLSKARETLYNRGMLITPPGNKTYPDIAASFNYYPIWQPYFDLNCDGQICTAQSGSSTFIVPIGIQRYQFAYDLSFPVLVTLNQPTAFNGRGYQFTYALEANLRNNQPVASGYQFIEPVRTRDILPNDPFGAIDQRTSGIVTINVFSGTTKLGTPIPAKKVGIDFNCGEQEATIGIVENGTLRARLPRCLNGILRANLLEGSSGIKTLNTMTDDDQEVNISIEPARPMNFTFKKIKMRRTQIEHDDGTQILWQVDSEAPRVDLEDYQEATVVLRKFPDYPGQEPFTAVATIYGNSRTTTDYCGGGPKQDNRENIGVVPGRYQLTVIALSYKDLEIPPDERKEDDGVMIDVQSMDTKEIVTGILTGGLSVAGGSISSLFSKPAKLPGISFNCTSPLVLANYDANITVTKEELDNNNEMEFASFTFDLEDTPPFQRKVEDLSAMEVPRALANIYTDKIAPLYYKRK